METHVNVVGEVVPGVRVEGGAPLGGATDEPMEVVVAVHAVLKLSEVALEEDDLVLKVGLVLSSAPLLSNVPHKTAHRRRILVRALDREVVEEVARLESQVSLTFHEQPNCSAPQGSRSSAG